MSRARSRSSPPVSRPWLPVSRQAKRRALFARVLARSGAGRVSGIPGQLVALLRQRGAGQSHGGAQEALQRRPFRIPGPQRQPIWKPAAFPRWSRRPRRSAAGHFDLPARSQGAAGHDGELARRHQPEEESGFGRAGYADEQMDRDGRKIEERSRESVHTLNSMRLVDPPHPAHGPGPRAIGVAFRPSFGICAGSPSNRDHFRGRRFRPARTNSRAGMPSAMPGRR